MENQLFRKKSVERISSPEELHDYMRVTGPRLWMLLGAVVALLAGFIAYASTATIENVMSIRASVENVESSGADAGPDGALVRARVPLTGAQGVQPGMKVRMANREGKVDFAYTEGEELVLALDFGGDLLNLPDGQYDAELVLESTTPISFLWN